MDKLVSFALPLMLSGILQLMFNAVDIIVVGRFSGSESLAAVGSTTALINVFTNLFIGISLGANVLAARFYAAGREKEMSETVHTAITFAIISGVVMALVGLFFSRGALELMGTPDNVINLSTLYMKIYFLGMPFFMLYNYGAAILRAVGDTKRPLLFLIVAGVINACLNLLLVDNNMEDFETVYKFNKSVGLPTCLKDLEFTKDSIEQLAENAVIMKDIEHNPYVITKEMLITSMEKLEELNK